MTGAYILVEALPGKSPELKGVIESLEGVKSVHLVTGPYDLIVYAEVADLKSIGEKIVRKIQASGDVSRTLTCITVE